MFIQGKLMAHHHWHSSARRVLSGGAVLIHRKRNHYANKTRVISCMLGPANSNSSTGLKSWNYCGALQNIWIIHSICSSVGPCCRRFLLLTENTDVCGRLSRYPRYFFVQAGIIYKAFHDVHEWVPGISGDIKYAVVNRPIAGRYRAYSGLTSDQISESLFFEGLPIKVLMISRGCTRRWWSEADWELRFKQLT